MFFDSVFRWGQRGLAALLILLASPVVANPVVSVVSQEGINEAMPVSGFGLFGAVA